jgi:hypothetical protein
MLYTNEGKAIVILMNSENGEELAWEIFRSVSNVLNWPKDELKVKTKVKGTIKEEEKNKKIGNYKNENEKLKIMEEKNEMYVKIKKKKYKLFSENENNFFTEEGHTLQFTANEVIVDYPNGSLDSKKFIQN